MANYMKQVAKILGVELNENFVVIHEEGRSTVKLTENGLVFVFHLGGLKENAKSICLYNILNGDYKIERIEKTLTKKDIMKEYTTCEEVLQALRQGKKIVGIGHLRRLCEGGIGCQNARWYKVLYYYCNPQMNRTFAMLENGMSVDSSIDALDFLYGKFHDYEEENNVKEVPKRLTKEQIEKELGYKIEIVD